MQNVAYFKFIGNLNDFLPLKKKETFIPYFFNNTPAVKDAIEAIGIPHVEVHQIIAENDSVDFYYKPQPGDNITVYPIAESTITAETASLVLSYKLPLKFIADVHLGKLVKALRMFGIDVANENNYGDHTIVQIATNDDRIVLTRDVGLLKHKVLNWGYWLRSQKTEAQLQEVIARYVSQLQIAPFTRCLECNGSIVSVAKEDILEKLPPNTKMYFTEFYQCASCHRVYWKGSHFERMEELVKKLSFSNK